MRRWGVSSSGLPVEEGLEVELEDEVVGGAVGRLGAGPIGVLAAEREELIGAYPIAVFQPVGPG